MGDHPPFRSTYPRSELGPPSSASTSPPPARASTLSSSLASYSFPGRLVLPEPPSSHQGRRSEFPALIGESERSLHLELQVPASGSGGRSVTPTQASASTSTQPKSVPRVVSGSQSLSSLLNHNDGRNDAHDDRVPSPRPRAHAPGHAMARYQTTVNQMTGLPSPENSPPLYPPRHPSPPRHHIHQQQQQQHRLTHRTERMDFKPFSNPDWAAEERPVDSTRRRAKMSPVKDYHSASMSMSMPISRSASNSRPQSSTGTGTGEVLVSVKEEQHERDQEQAQGQEQDELQEESPKKQKKRTRLNPEQGALLKKVWREVSLGQDSCVISGRKSGRVDVIALICTADLFPEHGAAVLVGRADWVVCASGSGLVSGESRDDKSQPCRKLDTNLKSMFRTNARSNETKSTKRANRSRPTFPIRCPDLE
jgi:hypothetical protein